MAILDVEQGSPEGLSLRTPSAPSRRPAVDFHRLNSPPERPLSSLYSSWTTSIRKFWLPLATFTLIGACYLVGLGLVLVGTLRDYGAVTLADSDPVVFLLDTSKCRGVGTALFVFSVVITATWLMKSIDRLRQQQAFRSPAGFDLGVSSHSAWGA